jgi:hypothetical protein
MDLGLVPEDLAAAAGGNAAAAAAAIAGTGLDLGLDLHDRLLARERDAPLSACPGLCGLYVVWLY